MHPDSRTPVHTPVHTPAHTLAHLFGFYACTYANDMVLATKSLLLKLIEPMEPTTILDYPTLAHFCTDTGGVRFTLSTLTAKMYGNTASKENSKLQPQV